MTVSRQDHTARYRWFIVAAATTILALVMGQLVNGLAVYTVPLENDKGWGRGAIAMINSSGLIGLTVGSLIMGFVAERHGIRRVALVGVLTMGLCTLLASRADSLWQLYLVFFIAGTFGGGSLIGPLMSTVGGWFKTGAGLAIGIVAAGQALGQGGMPFTGAFLIEAFGWRGALALQGMATLVLLTPLTLVLRDPPMTAGDAVLAETTPSGLSNSAVTWAMAAAGLFCCTCMAVPLMHLVPMMQGRGFSAPEASSVLMWLLLVAIAGRVAFGRLADMIGALPTWMFTSAWQTALVFGFLMVDGISNFYLFSTLYAFGYGGVMTGLLASSRELAAPARRTSTTGIVLSAAYLGHGLGGWQGGFVFDLTGAYSWTFGNAVLAGAANLAILGTLWMTIRRQPGRVAA